MIIAALVQTPPGGNRGRGTPNEPFDAGLFGMWIFLGALSILFAATLVLYVIFRLKYPDWRGPDAPPLPSGLWVSTAVLLASSVTMSLALHMIRRNARNAFTISMLITTVLGIAFLVLQYLNWRVLFDAGFGLEIRTDMKPIDLEAAKKLIPYKQFYLMTGLHAAHVIGGIVPLLWVTIKALLGGYAAGSHAGVRYCAIYWHFLDVVWLILFAVLMITG